jgi:HlyD family secretion protein
MKLNSRRTRNLFMLLAATVALGAAWPALTQDKARTSRGVAALGRLEPEGGIVRVSAALPETVAGVVVSRLVVERGQDLKAGQLIGETDMAMVAKARLAEAQAGLETARRDAKAAAASAEEACVQASVAARQSRRKTELQGRGLASSEETEVAKGDAEAGAASCKSRNAATGVAESRIASAQALLAQRQAELERTSVRAPFAGRVLDVVAEPGEFVGPGGIVEMGRVDSMLAIAEVYETDIRLVKVGQRATVRSDALAKPLQGAVTRIRPKVQKMDQIGDDPAARKDARIVEVEIKLDDSGPAANLTNLQVEIEIGR